MFQGDVIAGRKKRILFIGYFIPPITGSHGIRLRNFISYLATFGWEIDVLTVSSSPGFPYYDQSLVGWSKKGVRISRTFSGPISKIYWALMKTATGKPRYTPTSDIKVTDKKNSSLPSRVLNFISSIPLVIAGSAIEWYPFGVLQGHRLTKKRNYDILISSASPYTCHLIAYALKKRTGLPLVLDYGDPWAFNPALSHIGIKFQMEYKMEQKILDVADVVVVTTEETRRDYLKHYPFLNEEKVIVIPMGVECNRFKEAPIEKSEEFKIVYCGGVVSRTQDTKPFLDALKLFYVKQEPKRDIKLLFTGSIGNDTWELIEDMQLQDRIKLMGFIPYKKIPSLLMGADVLLFLGHKGGLQVPGKLFEYLAARRPILCIKGDENDPSLRFFEGLNRGIIVNNKTEEIYSALIQFYNLSKKKMLDTTFNLAETSGISWKERSEALSRLCTRLAEK